MPRCYRSAAHSIPDSIIAEFGRNSEIGSRVRRPADLPDPKKTSELLVRDLVRTILACQN
jgi:hypothetical protein